MSAAKHTPGPWTHRNGRIFQTDRESLTIANVARAADGDYSPTNGLLIAAAPDLLEVVCEMEAFSEAAMNDAIEEGDLMLIETWRTRMDHCRAAIAKAAGSAS